MDLMARKKKIMMMLQETEPVNLFDKDTMFSEMTIGYLKDDGSIRENSYWFISDYIPVNGDSFVLKNVGGGNPSVCLYDGNKNYIAGKKYGTSSSIVKTDVYITSSTIAKYCRFSAYSTTTDGANLMNYTNDIVLQYY